jgi:hypothetical protein
MSGARSVRLAVVLWMVFAFAVWNVIFDRTLVLAGRRYVYAASMAATHGDPYLTIDSWMRPAIARGVRLASLASGAIVAAGLIAIYAARSRDRRRAGEEPPCPPSTTR